jgi:hypothetical protein
MNFSPLFGFTPIMRRSEAEACTRAPGSERGNKPIKQIRQNINNNIDHKIQIKAQKQQRQSNKRTFQGLVYPLPAHDALLLGRVQGDDDCRAVAQPVLGAQDGRDHDRAGEDASASGRIDEALVQIRVVEEKAKSEHSNDTTQAVQIDQKYESNNNQRNEKLKKKQ